MRHGGSAALVGSLLLLAASFVLLVLGPTLLARFQGSAEAAPGGGYLNIAAASGIALGGGAAMIAVVSRLVRDIEIRPYAGLAPVLAVFAGFGLWSLRAELPLLGTNPEYVGIFALAVSVAGGALIVQPGGGARVMGWLLAFFAPVTVLLMLWSSSGKAQFADALASFSPPAKVFVLLLGASALTLAILGEVAGALRRKQARPVTHEMLDDDEPVLSLRAARASAPQPARASSSSSSRAEPRASTLPPLSPRLAPALRSSKPLMPGADASAEPERILPTPDYAPSTTELWRAAGTSSAPRKPQSPSADAYDAYVLQSHLGQQPLPRAAASSDGQAESYTPKVSVWDFEDEPLTVPKQNSLLRVLLLLVVLIGGGGAAFYYGVMLPKQQKEQAALQVLNQRKAELQAAEEREAQAKREAAADKAAAQQMEKLLNAPAAGAEQAPATGAEQAAPSLSGASAIAPKP